MCYHPTTSEENHWVLGLRDMSTKASDKTLATFTDNTLATFKEVLEDITHSAEKCQTVAEKHILGT